MFSDLYSTCYALANAIVLRLVIPGQVVAVYFALELLLPRATRNSLSSYLRSIRFWLTAIAINTVAFTALDTWMHNSPEALLANRVFAPDKVSPLTVIDLSPLTGSDFLPVRMFGWFVAGWVVAMVGDFFYYWLHRVQHSLPLLWRFHKVHHSITELSAASSYHHVVEDMLQLVCVVLPAALLVHFNSGPVPWLIATVAASQAYFIHSSARINIGPLRYLIGDNRYHRIHHSREPRHFNKNFAAATPLWDLLFGTVYIPKGNEWPQVGLDDTPEPKRIWDYLVLPFRPAAKARPDSVTAERQAS